MSSTDSNTEFFSDQKIPYKTIDNTELSLHIFSPPNHTKGDASPAIVFFFGGGWNSGTPEQFYPQSAYLAERGMVAIAAEYRTKNSHEATPKDCVADAKSAMRWMRSHAADLGIDSQKIVAGGGSAGAHLAAATATLEAFNAPDDDLTVSCKPQALVLFNPVYDNGPDDGYGHERVQDYWEAFSPAHNLSSETPPAITLLGTKDHLIPVTVAERFVKRMQAYGVRSELHVYPEEEHGFFNYGRGACYTQTLIEVDRFLESLGFLEGPPTLKES